MRAHIFRQYDIRGIVGVDFDADDVLIITQEFIRDLQEQGFATQRVAVGFDGRVHSPALRDAVWAALAHMECSIVDLGLIPTPLMYFALHRHYADVGIMITASHNGPEYNGLKLCRGIYPYAGTDIARLAGRVKGTSFDTISLRSITQDERLRPDRCHKVPINMINPEATSITPAHPEPVEGWNVGYNSTAHIHVVPIIDRYVEYLAPLFQDLQGAHIPAVFDAGHGAAGPVVEKLLERLQIQGAHTLYTDVDGTWPVRGPDPSERANQQPAAQTITQQGLRWGGCLDGDGDRLVILDEQGQACAGDHMLALWLQHAEQMFGVQPDGIIVVCDSKCSLSIDRVAHQTGARVVRTATGHTSIKHAMRTQQALCGGELSCHFFFADTYFGYDDGIYAWLRMARFMNRMAMPLGNMCRQVPHTFATPEQRIACAEDQKEIIMHRIQQYVHERYPGQYQTYDGIRYEGADGWWLIRPAHTQPVLCVRAESDTPAGLQELEEDIARALHHAGYERTECVSH